MSKKNIFWFRRDLRLQDNTGLIHALESGLEVQCIFIFDKNILDKLATKSDPRVTFIFEALKNIQLELDKYQSKLWVFHSTPEDVFKSLMSSEVIHEVYTNHDYEPYAINRDLEVKKLLSKKGIEFKTYKDQAIFEKLEIAKDDGTAYTIFTPYKNKWLKSLNTSDYKVHIIPEHAKFNKSSSQETKKYEISEQTLNQIGFIKSDILLPNPEYKSKLDKYAQLRDIPSIAGTTRISIHLRFGTVSIRELVANSINKSEVWLNELIWRDFYFMILWNFPHVVGNAFKPAYDRITWRNNEQEFQAWCDGNTGYPIVDAGMRELNATGFMHNRVRMITASFLVKHLLVDWRWGEAYFAEKLLDYELSSNNGGWQWASSSGCDAAPYFRIFNPTLQTQKFDPKLEYIKKWVPEFSELNYPHPIVEHTFARERCLKTYKTALS